MLKDITIGQYFPGKSALHRLDPRIKIILTLAYIILIFFVGNSVGFALSILFLGACYLIAKIPLKMILKSLKPIVPILIFTGILNMLFITGDDPFFEWGIISISSEGIYMAIVTAIRVICLIAASSLLTYTTSPIALTDAIERLLKPLKYVKFPVHELAMMMSIALRLSPPWWRKPTRLWPPRRPGARIWNPAASCSGPRRWCPSSSPCLFRPSAGRRNWPWPWSAAAITAVKGAPG